MKAALNLLYRWADGPWARVMLFALVVVLASRLADTPVGFVALAAAVCLAYLNPRLALALLFGSAFLPYVAGFPVTAGYVVILALLPALLFNAKRALKAMPRAPALLLAGLFGLIMATYPFHRAIDLRVLFLGLIGLLEALWFCTSAGPNVRLALGDVALGLSAAFLVPFLANLTLLTNSPFWRPHHLHYLLTRRITVSFTEPNVVAGYIAAVYAALLFAASYRGRSGRYQLAYMLLLMLFLAAVVAAGGRAAILFAAAVTALAFVLASVKSIARARRIFCWPSVRLASLTAAAVGAAGFVSLTAVGNLTIPGVERLAATRSLEETGRPKSLRDAVEILDAIPLAALDYQAYLEGTARQTPHSSLISTVIFLGLFVSVPLVALILFPILDTLGGVRVGGSAPLGVALTSLFLVTQTIPQTVDRGTLVLVGVWFALSRLPRLGGSRNSDTAGHVPTRTTV